MSMTDESSGYVAVIQAAVDREKEVVGPVEAVERARDVEGLSLDDDGAVLGLERDGKAVLGDLVDVYVRATGDVAAFIIARRIENLPERDLDMPENLARHL